MGACSSKTELTGAEMPRAKQDALPKGNERRLPSLKGVANAARPGLSLHHAHLSLKENRNEDIHGFNTVECLVRDGGAPQSVVDLVRSNIIGKDVVVSTPFGRRRIVYADYTASGRALAFLEEFMTNVVYPLYANTHTEVSVTGMQTTHLREEARTIVAQSLNAPPDTHTVLFVGNGCTGAIDKFGRMLGLANSAQVTWGDTTVDMAGHVPESARPVVFHGPFEHHSNELWWRESTATCVLIGPDARGRADQAQLRSELEKYADRPLKLGSFSACSNVMGIREDTRALSELLHAHGALACFDFAGCAAYVKVDMCPEPSAPGKDASVDAGFFSPHKFVGGPGSTGLLVAKRSIFPRRATPTCPGGGTVLYVSPDTVDYETIPEVAEDAGTPGVLQAIRCGLAFLTKEAVGCETIERLEQAHTAAVLAAWGATPEIVLIGSQYEGYFEADQRTSIISFAVLAPEALGPGRADYPAHFLGRKMLHSNFVVQLLNDVYGVQGRSGCACAGPLFFRLFGFDDESPFAKAFRTATLAGERAVRPGWARVNFNYFISEEEAAFIRDAVVQIARHGWVLLPFYKLSPASGQYEHLAFQRQDSLRHLFELKLAPSHASYRMPMQNHSPPDYARVLDDAALLYKSARAAVREGVEAGTLRTVDWDVEPSQLVRDERFWPTAKEAVHAIMAAEPCERLGRVGAQLGLDVSKVSIGGAATAVAFVSKLADKANISGHKSMQTSPYMSVMHPRC